MSAIAPERSRLELKDQSGTVHMLYLTADAAQQLSKLQPDADRPGRGPGAGARGQGERGRVLIRRAPGVANGPLSR